MATRSEPICTHTCDVSDENRREATSRTMIRDLTKIAGNPRSLLWRTAMHEAGHAVCTIVLGGQFDYATLRQSDYGHTGGHVENTRGLSPYDDAVVTWAGPVTEFYADSGPKAVERMFEGAGVLRTPDKDYVTRASDYAVLRRLKQEDGIDTYAAMQSAFDLVGAELQPAIIATACVLASPKPVKAIKFRQLAELVDAVRGAEMDADDAMLLAPRWHEFMEKKAGK